MPAPASVVLGLAPIAAIVILWWLATNGPVEERVISPTILPSPVEVVRSVPDLFERDLFTNVAVSLRRVALGYALAFAVTLPLGVLMGSFGSARATLTPVVTASGYIPIATLVPLTLSWFGTGEKQKIVFLAMAFGIYLLPLIERAIASVPDVYVKTSRTLGARTYQVVLKVLLPIAAPDIWHAMRLAFGVGWTYLVLAEVVVLESGLGYLTQISFRRGPREHIYLVIAIITLIAWVADLIWERVGRMLFRYRGAES